MIGSAVSEPAPQPLTETMPAPSAGVAARGRRLTGRARGVGGEEREDEEQPKDAHDPV